MTVLADTSVWIQHFRAGESTLAFHLSEGHVLMHPFILGELACSNFKNRHSTLFNLNALPTARMALGEEVLELIARHRLWGKGLGWIDIHLLASALLSRSAFWTLDKRLAQAAIQLGLSR